MGEVSRFDEKLETIVSRQTKLELGGGVVVVDVFCGAGGLSLGLKSAGLTIAAGIDMDPVCRFPFEQNIKAKFYLEDIAKLSGAALKRMFGKAAVKVLVGCAPCQPFSGYTTGRRDADERWRLLLHFLRLTQEVQPEIVTLENVPRLTQLPLWNEFVSALQAADYEVAWQVLDASDFGVPQSRRRVVLLASRLGSITLPKATSTIHNSVRSAIGSLAPVAAATINTEDRLHVSRRLTDQNLARIRISRPAGTWKQWPVELRASCHRTKKGSTYPSVYGRMSWDKPAPTITTQFYGFGNGRFGHPEQNRAITLREGAILQTFPPEFEFVPQDRKVSFNEIGRLIGNAVPPRLGEAIGSAILAHLSSGFKYPLRSR